MVELDDEGDLVGVPAGHDARARRGWWRWRCSRRRWPGRTAWPGRSRRGTWRSWPPPSARCPGRPGGWTGSRSRPAARCCRPAPGCAGRWSSGPSGRRPDRGGRGPGSTRCSEGKALASWLSRESASSPSSCSRFMALSLTGAAGAVRRAAGPGAAGRAIRAGRPRRRPRDRPPVTRRNSSRALARSPGALHQVAQHVPLPEVAFGRVADQPSGARPPPAAAPLPRDPRCRPGCRPAPVGPRTAPRGRATPGAARRRGPRPARAGRGPGGSPCAPGAGPPIRSGRRRPRGWAGPPSRSPGGTG